MPTDNCSSCGARLSPGIEWCGQCYTRVPTAALTRTTAPAPMATAPPAPAADPQKVLPPDFDFRVDQQLAALRTQARPIPKSAVFGTLALGVALARGAE